MTPDAPSSAPRAALILGCAVWPDGPSPTLRRRTLHGAALFHAGAVTHLVPCGGLGRHPPAEAIAMRDLLRAAGVPDDRIRPEAASTRTAENIRLALPILRALDCRDVVIVSDWYHCPRAALIARSHGLRAAMSWPDPRGGRLMLQARLALREVPALIWAALGPGRR